MPSRLDVDTSANARIIRQSMHSRMATSSLKTAINKALSAFGLSIVNSKRHEIIEQIFRSNNLLESPSMMLLYSLDDTQRSAIYPHFFRSKSQLAQDLFVIGATASDPTWPRYFVEFGATDGVRLSNTHLLEKHLGWHGILAEPAKIWHKDLMFNRSCAIDIRCVSKTTGETVEFLETSKIDPNDPLSSPELSSMSSFAESGDAHALRRMRNSKRYTVTTVSLNDLLIEHHAPFDIGYLSIDTEGSELSILQGFDFSKHKIRIITVEHNYVEPDRTRIHDLLINNGFTRVHKNISQWDDWYLLLN